jgi:hypothetical protein
MRKRSGVSKTGPVALGLVLLLCAAALQMRRRFSELSPKNFWVVPCSAHVTGWCRLQRAFNGLRPAVGATWLWFVGRLWWWRGLACGRRWVCGAHRGLVEVTALAWGCAPVVWVAGCVGWEPWWMPAARGVGPSRCLVISCSDPGDELLRNVLLPGRFATPLRFFSSRPPARSARCPLREPDRCHSVHDDGGAAAEKRSANQHGRRTAYGPPQATPPQAQTPTPGTHRPGAKPPRNIKASAAENEEQVAQPPGEHNELRYEPRHGRPKRERPAAGDTNGGTRNRRKNPRARGEAPDVNESTPARTSAPQKLRTRHHDDEQDDEPSDGEAGDAQPPRSGDTTDKAAQRPGKHDEERGGSREGNETGRAQRGRGAQRSTRNKTTTKTLTRRKACRGARAAREGRPQARKQKEGPLRGETKRRAGRSANRETRRARGAAPSPLNMPAQPLPPKLSRRSHRFFAPGPRLPPAHHNAPPIGGAVGGSVRFAPQH